MTARPRLDDLLPAGRRLAVRHRHLASGPPRDPDADFDAEAAAADIEEKLPGLLATVEPDDPGMHTSDTIDFEVILSGQVVLELDDGAEQVLCPGDTVVQNGTRHRWKVPGPEPAVMAIFMVRANRA